MDWTKIPTTLITKRYTDYELISIIKFQLLWAELEEQPDKKTALRYMTAGQYDTAMTYLDSIATGVGGAVSSMKRKREAEKIRYSKNKDLRNILPAECQQNVSRLPSQIREDKIREDKRIKENLFVDPAGVPPKHFDASDVIQRWNAIAERYKLPKIAMLTKERKTRLERLLKELKITPDEFFNTLDEQIRVSPFLQGIRLVYEAGETRKENKDWKSSFDFFLERGKFLKTKEGNYADPDLV